MEITEVLYLLAKEAKETNSEGWVYDEEDESLHINHSIAHIKLFRTWAPLKFHARFYYKGLRFVYDITTGGGKEMFDFILACKADIRRDVFNAMCDGFAKHFASQNRVY